MKYSLTINLEKLWALAHSNNPGYNYDDAAILDYIFHFCRPETERIREFERDGITYYHVDYEHLLNNLPLLTFKNGSSVTRRIQKLEKDGFITTAKGHHHTLYVRILPKTTQCYSSEFKFKRKS